MRTSTSPLQLSAFRSHSAVFVFTSAVSTIQLTSTRIAKPKKGLATYMAERAVATDSRSDDDDRLSVDPFEAVSTGRTEREVATPLTPRYSTFKKLEVVNARKVNAMAGLYNLLSFAAVGLSGIVVILSRSAFGMYESDVPVQTGSPGQDEFRFIDVEYYDFPDAFIVVDACLNYTFFAYSLFLVLAFIAVLVKAGRERLLNEQIWVAMLLFGTTLYLNPSEATMRLREKLFGIPIPQREQGLSYVDLFTCLRMLSFSTISLLYVWMGSHSYRYLQERITIWNWEFYVPKIALALIYNAYKLSVLFVFRIAFSELPFATLVAFLALYGNIGVWPRLGVITVAILTALETVIFGLIVVDVMKTMRVLSLAEYVKHRTKILGFRFFLHQQGIFYLVYVCNYALILFGLPKGPQILQFWLLAHNGKQGRGSYFDVQYAPLGLQLCILAYVTTEAYTNLPALFSLQRLKFWSRERDGSTEVEPEPIVYRNREPPSFSGDELEIKPNCFIMQTNVELFNLAWFVYYHGTSKESKLTIDYDALTLKIRDSFYSKRTDTRAFVAESRDRIIVAFKGTTSRQNLFTDVKVMHRSLSQFIRLNTLPNGNPRVESRVFFVLKSKSFQRAKVHSGFVEAYNSIREELIPVIATLLREKNRPIFFTGHSLGGALATLSSLDVSLGLNVPGTRILVSTFGSPRVGNNAFREVYDDQIPMNWRLVAGGDIISRLPKVGYTHVGKRVVLTAAGELFIDPSALEIIFWYNPRASFVHHRKAWYMLSLKTWCASRLDDYSPDLWPFPVSASDSRKFEISLRKPISRNLPPLSRRGKVIDRVEKFKMWADAIDDLNVDIQDERSLDSWRRLAARVLEKIRNDSSTVAIPGHSLAFL